MLLSLDNYLHAINLKDRLAPSRDIDDQKILQSDWVRRNWPQPTKSGSLRCYLHLMTYSMQKNYI